VCVKPLLDNPRIIRQEGAFLLFGCDKTKDQPAKLEGAAIAARLTIKRDEKRNLLDQLRTLGISRATMFPEIEHVATQIKQSHFVPSIDESKLSPRRWARSTHFVGRRQPYLSTNWRRLSAFRPRQRVECFQN
jgi:hypothetical protein